MARDPEVRRQLAGQKELVVRSERLLAQLEDHVSVLQEYVMAYSDEGADEPKSGSDDAT